MNVTGHVQVKNGKFYAVLNLYGSDGKRYRKWIKTGLPVRGNKKAAEKFLQEKIEEWNSKEDPRESISLSQYLTQWIEKVEPELKKNTYRMYRSNMVNHIIPYFKKHEVTLHGLRPPHLENYYRSKLETGSNMQSNEALSPTSIRHHHQVISRALSDAVREGLLEFNPASAARTPKGQKYMANFLNMSEVKAMLSLFSGSPIELPVTLCAIYGFRRSEVLGLKWKSVDFNKRSITVSETLQQGIGGNFTATPKTESGYRTLPMTETAYQLLQEHKRNQEQRKSILGTHYIDNDYVCTWNNGEVITPNYLSRNFHNTISKSKLPQIRLHDLRHSVASNLLNMGFSVADVQGWLGHGSATTTLNFYAHADKSLKTKMGDEIEKGLHS